MGFLHRGEGDPQADPTRRRRRADRARARATRRSVGRGRDLHQRPVGQRVRAAARARPDAAGPGDGRERRAYRMAVSAGARAGHRRLCEAELRPHRDAAAGSLGQRFGETSESQIRSYLWATPVVCRLDTISDAWNLARRRALARLTDEATEVGADAVVGVSLQRADHNLGRRTVEYAVNGTAIRSATTTQPAEPVLTDLSVQDYIKLIRAGQEPVGLVATTVAVFASPSRDTRIARARTFRSNQELTEISRRSGWPVTRSARTSATRSHGLAGRVWSASSCRSRSGARSWRWRRRSARPSSTAGDGAASASRTTSQAGSEAERRGWVITMHAAGTAIRPCAGASVERSPDRNPVAPVTDLWAGGGTWGPLRL